MIVDIGGIVNYHKLSFYTTTATYPYQSVKTSRGEGRVGIHRNIDLSVKNHTHETQQICLVY
jgi:hypothetical protein